MKQKIAFAMVMGSITTAIVSLTSVTVNKGFVAGFASAWLKSWLISYTVAVPAILIIGPRVQSFINNRLAQKRIKSRIGEDTYKHQAGNGKIKLPLAIRLQKHGLKGVFQHHDW